MKQSTCSSLFSVVYTNYPMLLTSLSKSFSFLRVNICPMDLKWVGEINGISEQDAFIDQSLGHINVKKELEEVGYV